MVSTEYSEAAVEVLEILNHIDNKLVSKIPEKFMNFLHENKSDTYVPELDFIKPIKELNLKDKTHDILGLIYLNYWANEDEKKRMQKKIETNEKAYLEALSKKHDGVLFKENKPVYENVQLQSVVNKTIFQKIIEKIKNIFRRI